jgi:hypothetical protein
MSSTDNFDTLEIADLEQDIGGVSAVEPAESYISPEGALVTMFLPPK